MIGDFHIRYRAAKESAGMEPAKPEQPSESTVKLSFGYSGADNSILTISGNDVAMGNYSEANKAPWSGKSSVIKEVIAERGVTSIGGGAFSNFSALETVTIPDTVTTIGANAFFGCVKLGSINIPSSIRSIGVDAFKGCNGLTEVSYDGTPVQWEDIAGAAKCSDVDFKIKCSGNVIRQRTWFITGSTLKISDEAVVGKEYYKERNADGGMHPIPPWRDHLGEITVISLPDGVSKVIGNWAFAVVGQNYTNAWTVEGLAGTTSIGANAFYQGRLKSVEIPAGVETIGDSAFVGCEQLTTLTFASGSRLTSIGEYAFSGCRFTALEIPDSVTKIGRGAFASNNGLTDVKFQGTQTAWNAVEKGEALFDNSSLTVNCEISGQDLDSGEPVGNSLGDETVGIVDTPPSSESSHTESGESSPDPDVPTVPESDVPGATTMPEPVEGDTDLNETQRPGGTEEPIPTETPAPDSGAPETPVDE